MKNLNNRAANKPKLLPLSEDIMKLKQLLDTCAEEAYGKLKMKKRMYTACSRIGAIPMNSRIVITKEIQICKKKCSGFKH
jgi:hypothetical protein